MNRIQAVLLWLVAAFFATLWLGWMLQPAEMATRWHLSPLGTMGLNNLRGDAGGVFLATSAFCLLYLLRGRDPAWLRAGAVLLGAVLTGRIAGLVFDGFSAEALVSALVEAAFIVLFLRAAGSSRA